MTEYISKEDVIAKLDRFARDPYHETHYIREAAINTIKRMEAADVQEVKRANLNKLLSELRSEDGRIDYNSL